MRGLQEVLDSSPEGPAFSNGTEVYNWMSRWCDRCQHPVELAWQAYSNGKRKTQLKGFEGGCPLLMAAMTGDVTPSEWLVQESGPDRYHCVEFRGPDDGGEPQPLPDPPGMDGLFERPEARVRMLQQPEMEAVSGGC